MIESKNKERVGYNLSPLIIDDTGAGNYSWEESVYNIKKIILQKCKCLNNQHD